MVRAAVCPELVVLKLLARQEDQGTMVVMGELPHAVIQPRGAWRAGSQHDPANTIVGKCMWCHKQYPGAVPPPSEAAPWMWHRAAAVLPHQLWEKSHAEPEHCNCLTNSSANETA